MTFFSVFFHFIINIHHSILKTFKLETTKKSPDMHLRCYFSLKQLGQLVSPKLWPGGHDQR